MSEWGNPPCLSKEFLSEYIGQKRELGELKHLSSQRKKKKELNSIANKRIFVCSYYYSSIPLVVASEKGTVKTTVVFLFGTPMHNRGEE